MFIWVTGGLTVLPEDSVVPDVCNYVDGELPAEFEPLRPFSPLLERDVGHHVAAVAATPVPGGVVIGVDETVVGVDQVFVDCAEVVDGDAAL